MVAGRAGLGETILRKLFRWVGEGIFTTMDRMGRIKAGEVGFRNGWL
jgi:hypothetical protein